MNESVNKEQSVHNRLNGNGVNGSGFWYWFRGFCLAFMLGGGFLALFLLVVFSYVASAPVNLTPIVKYWLPFPAVKGIEKNRPAGFLTLDSLIMEWPIQEKGFSAGITFKVTGLKLINASYQVKDHLDHGAVTLRPVALWHGIIAPLSVKVSGADFHFKRDRSNHVLLDLPGQKQGTSSDYKINLSHLYHVETEKTALQLIDEIHHHEIQLTKFDVNIHPFHVGKTLVFIGQAMAVLDVNGHRVQIKAQTLRDRDSRIQVSVPKTYSLWKRMIRQTGRVQWHVQVDPINPADIAEMLPTLHALNVINLPVSAVADVGFKVQGQETMQPDGLDLSVGLGQGQVVFKNQVYYPSSGQAQIHVRFTSGIGHPVNIGFPSITLQLRAPNSLQNARSGPFFRFKGGMELSSLNHPQSVAIKLDASSPLLDFSTLKDYWPSVVAPGAYSWVTENMTQGIVHDFSIHASLIGREGWHHLKLAGLTGGIRQATGLEVYWLKAVPPLRQMNAQMVFVDPDRIQIKYQGGYQTVYSLHGKTSGFHKLFIPQGEMWISGLSNRHELGSITLSLQGRLQDMLTLLAEPRLKLLSRHPVPFKNPSGNLKTDLHVEVPLKKKVKMEQVVIKGHNEIRNVFLDDVALGQPLKKADVTVDVDTHRVMLTGKGSFSVFPVVFSYQQNFIHQSQSSIMETAQADLAITPDTLKASGFDMIKDMAGNARLRIDYAKHYNRQSEVNLMLDLLGAELNLPIWHKERGQPATVSGKVLLDNNRLVGIRQLHAEGNNLLVLADMNVMNSVPRQLNIQYFKTGRSIGKATVNFPMTKETLHNPLKGNVRISVKASDLDLAPFIQQYRQISKEKHSAHMNYQLPVVATGKYIGPKGRHWTVNLQADKVYYNHDGVLENVTAYMEYNGVRMVRMSYAMQKPFLMTASLFPKGLNRQFYLDAQNLGKMLSVIGMSTRIEGGHLVLRGQFDDASPEAPFTGKVIVEPFKVKQVPFALKQLSGFSFDGWLHDHGMDEIHIDALKGNLYLNKGILQIKNGRVYNNALGATLQGNINLDQAMLDLQGTIVPLYAVNKLLGHLPAVGKFFVPEKGGGVVALPFGIKGKFKDPKMEIYSSKVFMPGMLRQLF